VKLDEAEYPMKLDEDDVPSECELTWLSVS